MNKNREPSPDGLPLTSPGLRAGGVSEGRVSRGPLVNLMSWRIRRYWRQYVVRLIPFGVLVGVLMGSTAAPWRIVTATACAGILLALAWLPL